MLRNRILENTRILAFFATMYSCNSQDCGKCSCGMWWVTTIEFYLVVTTFPYSTKVWGSFFSAQKGGTNLWWRLVCLVFDSDVFGFVFCLQLACIISYCAHCMWLVLFMCSDIDVVEAFSLSLDCLRTTVTWGVVWCIHSSSSSFLSG